MRVGPDFFQSSTHNQNSHMNDSRSFASSSSTAMPPSFNRASFASASQSSAYPPLQSPSAHTDLYSPPISMLAQNAQSSSRTARQSNDTIATPSLSMTRSDPAHVHGESRAQNLPTISLRKLPRNFTQEGLRSMLLFAGDLVGTEFVGSRSPEDAGYSTAIAQFRTLSGANEARERLHGKANATNDADMVVEVMQNSLPDRFASRRNTIDVTPALQHTNSGSSSGSSQERPSRQPSRYNSTFQSIDNVSPPMNSRSHLNGDLPGPDTSSHVQDLFSPQSPVGNVSISRYMNETVRNSGRSVINDDTLDDETGELLRDPLAYARNGQHQASRRKTNPQIPTAQFGNMTLGTTTSNGNSSNSGITSPRLISKQQSPSATMSPTVSPNSAYPMGYQRHNFPAANPADQNPPCNTLYVGNLPLDTHEDELKSVFSRQRGYKRLCFRTKHNGPMCFVEFEDVSFATKALNELYGYTLTNSIKGGIRLSFSKNPLGVRTGQMNGLGPNSPMSPQAMSPGFGNGIVPPPGFASQNGPPPGLAMSARTPSFGQGPVADGPSAMYHMNSYGMSNPPFNAQLRSPVHAGMHAPHSGALVGGQGSDYSAYMMSR